jgi:cytochrome bd-type quinol oxidase subunit 2
MVTYITPVDMLANKTKTELLAEAHSAGIKGSILYLIAVILVIIWAIGFIGGYATSGIIHILLVIAVIVVLLRIIRGNA